MSKPASSRAQRIGIKGSSSLIRSSVTTDTTDHQADIAVVRPMELNPAAPLLREQVLFSTTKADWEAVLLVEANRPRSLRKYDQIPMVATDLLHQAKVMMPHLADRSIVFVGDYDSMSLLLGLLGAAGNPHPQHMLMLDFDERLLDAANSFADRFGFGSLLQVRLYNVFDPLPEDIVGKYDWFYTNPPYGCRNNGESARLFTARGCESVRPAGGKGCIILPDDANRPWTQQAMLATQRFLGRCGWNISRKLDQMHRYHLDDDQDLTSSMMVVDHISSTVVEQEPIRYGGRRVDIDEIPHFYGLSTPPPYPRYIRLDGAFDYDWMASELRQL